MHPPASSRRDFIKGSAALAAGVTLARPLSAASRNRVIGANSRLRIGCIGCGNRGRTAILEKGLIPHLAAANFEIIALADPWRVAREETNALVKTAFGREARAFTHYRDLLALEGLDAVVIASPDHHHTTHLEAAAKAGKHIYIEKPLATGLAQLLRAYDAAKAAQAAGSVIQIGTQIRSFPGVVGAREVLRSGVLGKISRVEESRNGEKPYWYQYLGRDVRAADVDWPEFLGDRPPRPFNAGQYSAWYGHYEFSQGPIPQLGVHFLDTAHFILDCGLPASCVCTGGTFTWHDEHGFTAPDCVQATWIYPEGFLLTSSNNFGNGSGNGRKFYGTKGTLSLDNWNAPTYSAEGGPKRDGQIRGKQDVKPVARPDHFLNWLQCMRSGETPHASIDAGFQHAVAALMAVASYETGQKTTYDATRRQIVPA
jgi:predicted dehydrogenase